MGWVMVWMPLILLLLGIPIFLLVLATCITAVVFFSSLPHAIIHQVLYDSVAKVPLVAVPFFLFTGDLMSRGGLSKRLLRWVASMVGGFRGSLPLTSLGFAAIFGAISGATTASVAAVGSITYPRLRAAGYSERFASALIVAECALDNLIPPSIAFIIYGIATETSVAASVRRRHPAGPRCSAAFSRSTSISTRSARTSTSGRNSAGRNSSKRRARASGRSARSSSSSAASIRACSRRPRRPASPASMRCSWRSSSIARPRCSTCSRSRREPSC